MVVGGGSLHTVLYNPPTTSHPLGSVSGLTFTVQLLLTDFPPKLISFQEASHY